MTSAPSVSADQESSAVPPSASWSATAACAVARVSGSSVPTPLGVDDGLVGAVGRRERGAVADRLHLLLLEEGVGGGDRAEGHQRRDGPADEHERQRRAALAVLPRPGPHPGSVGRRRLSTACGQRLWTLWTPDRVAPVPAAGPVDDARAGSAAAARLPRMSIEMPAAEVYALADTLRAAADDGRGDRRPARRPGRRRRRLQTGGRGVPRQSPDGRPGARRGAAVAGRHRGSGRRLVAGARRHGLLASRRTGARRMTVGMPEKIPLDMPPGRRRRRSRTSSATSPAPPSAWRCSAATWPARPPRRPAGSGTTPPRPPRRSARVAGLVRDASGAVLAATARLSAHADLSARGPSSRWPRCGPSRTRTHRAAWSRLSAVVDVGTPGAGRPARSRGDRRGARAPPRRPARRRHAALLAEVADDAAATARVLAESSAVVGGTGRPGDDGAGRSPTWRCCCPAGATRSWPPVARRSPTRC